MNKVEQTSKYLDRRLALPKLVGNPSDFLIVSGLAGAAKDVGQLAKEAPNTFLFGGAMGGATMTGLGLALAQPSRRVLVVLGDGDLLMCVGSLATISAMHPKNLAVICVDNELYGETGEQRTHTQLGTDLSAVASGFGIPVVHKIVTEQDIGPAASSIRQSNSPVFVLLKVNGGPPPNYNRNWHAEECKVAFRKALLGRR